MPECWGHPQAARGWPWAPLIIPTGVAPTWCSARSSQRRADQQRGWQNPRARLYKLNTRPLPGGWQLPCEECEPSNGFLPADSASRHNRAHLVVLPACHACWQGHGKNPLPRWPGCVFSSRLLTRATCPATQPWDLLCPGMSVLWLALD